MLLVVFALVLLLGAFTTFYFNKEVLTEPTELVFNLEGSLAPVGASLMGENGVVFYEPARTYFFYYSPSEGIYETIYSIDTNDVNVRNGLLNIKETVLDIYSIFNGGTYYRNNEGTILSPLQLSNSASVVFTYELNGNIVSLNYVETLNGVTTEKQFDIQIMGKTLVIVAKAINPSSTANNNYAGFSLGKIKGLTNLNYIEIPYMENAPIVYGDTINGKKYFSNYLDWTKSGSNDWPRLEFVQIADQFSRTYSSSYKGGEDNWISPLDETAYVTVTSNINEVMVKINRNPSQYLSDLKGRVTLDLWTTISSPYFSGTNRFQRSTTLINTMKNYGMDDLLVFYTPWFEFGLAPCSLMIPIHLPANSEGGGDVGFSNLVSTATNNGFLFTVYQIYNDMYSTPPNSASTVGPQWNPSNLVKNPDGTFRNFGWINQNCPLINELGQPIPQGQLGGLPQPLVIKPDKWLEYAQAESPIIKQNYQTTAAFLDVHTKLSYPLFIDYSVESQTRSFKDVFSYNNQLFNFQKDTYQGPLIGEGGPAWSGLATDTMHAGLVDAVEGEITNNKNAKIIPDFEIRNVKDLMMRQGMGYPNRWANLPSGTIDPATFNWDELRSMQISFGHSGFMSDYFLLYDPIFYSWPQNVNYHTSMMKKMIKYWINEYYLFSEFQKLYLESNVLNIFYKTSSGTLVNLAEAIDSNVDFSNPQLKIEYDNGLVVYINRNQNPLSIWYVNENGIDYYIPSNGWLGINSASNFLEYSALVDAQGNPDINGHRVDYIRSNNYIMVNGRGVETYLGTDYFENPIISKYLTVIKPNGWKLFELDNGEFCVEGSCPLPPEQAIINPLSPNSFPTSSNSPWITVTRATGGIDFVETFGIALRHQGTEWGESLYCYDSPTIPPGGIGTCEFLNNANTVRFKLQSNPVASNYEVKYVDYTNPSSLIKSNVVPLTVTTPICGDTLCNGAETCFSCEGDCGTCPNSNPYIDRINPNTIINTEFRNVQIWGENFYPRAIEFDGLEYSSFYGWTVSPNRDMINMVIPSGYPGGDKIIRVINTNNIISNPKTLRINYRFNYGLSLSPSLITLAPGASQEIQAIVNVLPFVDIEEVSFSVTADPQISYQFVGADKCTAELSGGEIKCSVRIRLTASPYLNLQTYSVQITGSSLTTNPQTEALGINTLPDAPSNLVVVALDYSSLKLDWIDNSNNENGFKLDYKLHSSSTWTSIDLHTPDTQTYTHSGLSASTEYDYRILAYNSFGNSEWYPLPTANPNYVSGTTNPGGSSSGSSGGSSGGSSSGGPPKILMQCNDKKDNDNDTFVDYPYDPGCLNKEDNIELDSVLININKPSNSTLKNDSTIDDGNDIQPVEKDIEIRLFFWLTILVLVLGMGVAVIITLRSIRQHKRMRELYSHAHNQDKF